MRKGASGYIFQGKGRDALGKEEEEEESWREGMLRASLQWQQAATAPGSLGLTCVCVCMCVLVIQSCPTLQPHGL